MRPLRDRRNSKRFQQAREEAEATGGMVCSTIAKDGTPLYFTLPRGASDEEADRAAFRAREGRPMNDVEAWVAEKARRHA